MFQIELDIDADDKVGETSGVSSGALRLLLDHTYKGESGRAVWCSTTAAAFDLWRSADVSNDRSTCALMNDLRCVVGPTTRRQKILISQPDLYCIWCLRSGEVLEDSIGAVINASTVSSARHLDFIIFNMQRLDKL